MNRVKWTVLRLAAAAAAALPAIRACAYTYTNVVDGIVWSYVLNGGSATVFDPSYKAAIPTSTSGAITIPSKLEDYPVTDIGDLAFAACGQLTGVTIPDGVTSIGDSAFVACGGLESVAIPNSVTRIGKYAFAACEGIKRATIPQVVCSAHLSTVFPSAYRTMKSVAVADGVTDIGDYLFRDCAGLRAVTIPDSVASIGEGAFSGCSAALFDTTAIPGVRLVDGWAVGYVGEPSGDLDLAGVRGIAAFAFENCFGITGVKIPDGVKGIGEGAFAYCEGVTNVQIDVGVEIIGDWAFAACAGLSSVTIPNSVTNIGECAFDSCGGLASIVFMGDAPSVKNEPFRYVAEDCVAYVLPSSTGWGVEEGGEWHGLTIKYMKEPEGDPEFEIVDVAVERIDASARRIVVGVVAKIDGNIVAVDPAKVAAMFEATSDLNDWDDAAKLTPAVEVLATDSDGKMTFAVTPGDGTAPSAFLRLRK